MAWIESHQELGDHPKTIKLAHLLEVSTVTAVGHLHYLWWWALTYAEDGDLSEFDDFDLARAARWDGDPTVFVKALIDCGPGARNGFLTAERALHDWWDYAGKLVDRRRKDRDRKAKSRANPSDSPESPSSVPRMSSGRPAEVDGSPYRTEQNPTEQNKNNPPVSPRRGKTAFPDDFDPNDTHKRIADELARDLQSEVADFRDDARAHDRRYKDWDAAFRKWLRNDRYRTNGHTNGQVVRLTAAEQRTQRSREARQRAIAELEAGGMR